ncbi:excalibur calcium-binding domain-containing protein [Corynebacterium pyruviciproducens]
MAKVSSRPRRWGRFLAWPSMLFGVMIVILATVIFGSLFMVLFGLVFLLPGAWWIISDRRDQKQWDRYEETVENNRRLATMIGDDNPDIVAGMGVVDPPSKRSRHWGIVSIVMVVLFAGFVVLAPKQETTSEETPPASASPTTSLTATTSKASTTRTTASSSSFTTTTTQSQEPTVTSTGTVEPTEAEVQPAAVLPPPPAPVEEAPTLTADAWPAPQQANGFMGTADTGGKSSYANCKDVWNTLGRPIRAGEPGYVAGHGKLDGDGDGVGCEKDPR